MGTTPHCIVKTQALFFSILKNERYRMRRRLKKQTPTDSYGKRRYYLSNEGEKHQRLYNAALCSATHF